MLNIEENTLLSNITTLGIGGPATKFVAVSSEVELKEAIKFAQQNNMDYLIIGGGSNLLVNDKGVDSLVIKNEITGITEDHLRGEAKQSPRLHLGGVILKVASGTILQDLVDYTIQHGLSGLQRLTGIPGTVGGAIFGNAGAYGQSISDHITSVVILDPSVIASPKGVAILTHQDSHVVPPKAELLGMTMSKEECNFGYRDSIFKRNHSIIILEVTFQLQHGDPNTLEQEAQDVLSKRLIKYPKGIKCPGSFFKNIVADSLPKEIIDKIPPDKITYGKISAGYLLEAVGAQGQKLDGIEIAPYHANLFINKGNGTAQTFYTLAQQYAQKVKDKFGIILEPEVQLINLPPVL